MLKRSNQPNWTSLTQVDLGPGWNISTVSLLIREYETNLKTWSSKSICLCFSILSHLECRFIQMAFRDLAPSKSSLELSNLFQQWLLLISLENAHYQQYFKLTCSDITFSCCPSIIIIPFLRLTKLVAPKRSRANSWSGSNGRGRAPILNRLLIIWLIIIWLMIK